MDRRRVLKAGLVLVATTALAAVYRPAGAALRVLTGGSKWLAKETFPPSQIDPNKRMFLTDKEVAQVKAIFDRLIPADEISMSASDAGCVEFVDHQLASPYGEGSWRYLDGPQQRGTDAQGDQSLRSPAQTYRTGLAELEIYCQKTFSKGFEQLSTDEQDTLLEQMESGEVLLETVPAELLFKQLLTNAQEGYFADPVYGGNKDMVGWKMIGFPGARYDYRDYVNLKNQKLDIKPVSIIARA